MNVISILNDSIDFKKINSSSYDEDKKIIINNLIKTLNNRNNKILGIDSKVYIEYNSLDNKNFKYINATTKENNIYITLNKSNIL